MTESAALQPATHPLAQASYRRRRWMLRDRHLALQSAGYAYEEELP